jgi:pimeloyl-ACP methyl ester carboxylesterase
LARLTCQRLLVHGNGCSIGFLAAQIEFFKNTHRVIVMDSRDQGRSSDSAVPLTYERMTDDLAALLDHLQTGPVDIVGWSDGGVQALLMGQRHPGKVRMLVAMAANLDPGGLLPEATDWIRDTLAAIPPEARDTPEGQRALKVTGMMLVEPQIDLAQLEAITAPTLILSGDHDMVRLQHTIAIYEGLPNGQLAILPNSTHAVPYDDPELFNTTVERFLTTPFRNKDPLLDTMSSLERLLAELPR